MTTTLDHHSPTWTKVTDGLTSGEYDGNYAGMVERIGSKWEARDAFGTLVGRFPTEEQARAALEPAALTAAWNEHERRERLIASITAVIAGGSAILTAIGFLTLAGL
jgi:hypothetical protein